MSSRLASSLLSLSALAAVGCATQTQMASVQCAAGGAVAGYAMCKLLGHKDKDCVKIAAGVGAIGAVGCYSYASNLDKRRKDLAGKENDLNARIVYVRGLNEDGAKLNAALREKVDAVNKRQEQLMAQVSKGKASSQQLAQERKQIDEELEAARSQAQLQQAAYDEAKHYRDGLRQSSPPLDGVLARQQQLVAEGQGYVDTLSRLSERVPA